MREATTDTFFLYLLSADQPFSEQEQRSDRDLTLCVIVLLRK